MDIRLRFGRNVKALRKATGLSQDEFADRASIHRTYMSGIERGKRAPTIIVVEQLALALGVQPGALFADDNSPPDQA
ncbi:helix-turn-helix domain-containing protein [Sphingomonas jatrophae]|uniref:Helix-turn-helix domain-containing protein n=1 Tax=Sphingomonas jatrophae TaxID=1166337 RepID=A0A1I6JSL6_9SPHN|nr:helix-turn-helix transcriptional regulator [Sphingomonas jatrophae]SFR81530.1 Helix-turn-helix domain-containing protein [Sphingomonas jatrophae]